MTTYTATTTFETFRFRGDFAQASSPIQYETDDGWVTSRHQVADARHVPAEAAALLMAEWGSDYWHDPSQPRPDDEEAAIRALIISVDEETAS